MWRGTPTVRTRLAAAAVAIAAAALTACGSDDPAAQESTTVVAPPTTTATAATTTTVTTAAPTTPANQVISVTVAGGKVTPPAGVVDVKLGSTVVLEVTVDAADELHVHGYDRTLALPAGQPGRLELAATIPGQFEVELHEGHLLLFTLRVS